jgi:hypothetical protein
MKISKIILSCIALFCCIRSFGQSSDFTKFAAHQDSMMMKEYYAKNPEEYKKYLDEFEKRYDTLIKRCNI